MNFKKFSVFKKIILLQELLIFSTFSVPTPVKTLTKNMIFIFFLIFSFFIIGNNFFTKIKKIIKKSYIFARGSKHCKNKGLGQVFRPKSRKSVNFINFTNYQYFLKFLVFSEIIDFLDFQRPVRILYPFRA